MRLQGNLRSGKNVIRNWYGDAADIDALKNTLVALVECFRKTDVPAHLYCGGTKLKVTLYNPNSKCGEIMSFKIVD